MRYQFLPFWQECLPPNPSVLRPSALPSVPPPPPLPHCIIDYSGTNFCVMRNSWEPLDRQTRDRMRCRNIIINHIIFFINPIIAILNTSVYTSVYNQSPVTHFLFWHFYFFSSFIFPAIFYPPPLEHNMPWFYANIYNTLIAGYFMLQIDYMPRIQQLSNIQFGCVGSLLSSWFMMFAYITADLDGYFVVSFDIYRSYTDTKLSL